MTVRPEHPSNHRFPVDGPGPLPPGVEPELREVDDLLSREAKQAEVPAGLADRIFSASVGDLPRPAVRRRPAPVVHVARRSLLSRFGPAGQWRGYAAMAASLGLAFVLASVFMRGPASQPDLRLTSYEVVFANAEEVLNADPLGAFDHEVSHILETGGWSSSDEVAGELEAIISAF
jgi:hypothetical protein